MIKKSKLTQNDPSGDLSNFAAMALDAASFAPTKEAAKAMLSGLSQSGWSLDRRLPKRLHMKTEGLQGCVAADVAAMSDSPAMAQALSELGVDWGAAAAGERSSMAFAASIGNWPALAAMADGGGDWLGRAKGRAAVLPSLSPMAPLWRPPQMGALMSFMRQGSSEDDFEQALGQLRKRSWLALEQAAAQGDVDPGPWASQVGASLLGYGSRPGGAARDAKTGAKLWAGLVERCAHLGWRFEGELASPPTMDGEWMSDAGVAWVDKPTLALALAVRAGAGDPAPLALALGAKVVDLDKRSIWALARGALENLPRGPLAAVEGLEKAAEALKPWMEELRGCLTQARGESDRAGSKDRSLPGWGELCAALCLPRRAPPSNWERSKKAAWSRVVRLLPQLGLAPGEPGWEAFKGAWARDWAEGSGPSPQDESWQRRQNWLWADEDSKGLPKQASLALAALSFLAKQGAAGKEMALAAMAGWAQAEARRAKPGRKKAGNASSPGVVARWALAARDAGLAKGEAAQALFEACSATLGGRAIVEGTLALESATAILEGDLLGQSALSAPARKAAPMRL